MVHPDDADFHYSSEAESDRFFALELGKERLDCAWILSDRDVWYPNPFYQGPPVKHPEDDSDLYNDDWHERAQDQCEARLEWNPW